MLLCYWLFCFFFFKQKTAYEMRISDWSSDVCSSDLAGETAAPINPAPALPPASPPSAGVARWHGSAWLFWRDGSATRADAVTGGRLGGSQSGVRLDRIGRASWRESVCQYV